MKRNVPQLACGRDVEGVTSSCAALSRPQKKKAGAEAPVIQRVLAYFW